jgi:hypothetical protein
MSRKLDRKIWKNPPHLCGRQPAKVACAKRYPRFQFVSTPRSCTRDEGRSLGAGLQELASNYLKLLWLNTRVVIP